MVWQQALYLVNLLCKFVPCDYNFPYPDTSLSEPQAFKDLITIGFDDPNNSSGSLKIGGLHGWGWSKLEETELDYTGNDPLVVVTKTGKLRGYWMRVVGGRKIRAFEGIPYAEPPIGHFRFTEPSPKIPWSGLLWANKKGPKCLQFSQIELKHKRVVGSEECLCLNVYAPKVQTRPSLSYTRDGKGGPGDKFPVVVFIHGGGFQIGAGNDYGPSYLLQKDVILVTFNYRVGVFGFLSTGDKASPGNYGLKDQALAIQWVYENIEAFNGDPLRITLIGQEAGGASVHLQMLSLRARPFFQAGISMSGSAFNPWVFCRKQTAKDLTKWIAKKLKCPVHSSEAIVSCLRRVDAADLARAQIKFLDDWPLPIYLFRPVIEEGEQKEPPFITESPEESYRKGLVAKIPWIGGFTEDEGLTFLLPSVFRGSVKQLRQNWNQLASDFLDYDYLKEEQDEITKKINWLYFKQNTPLTATIKTFSDALSMRFTVTGMHKAMQAHSTLAPTYGYMFSFNGKYNLATLAGIKPNEWGVGQGEDLFYLLNSTHFYQGFKKTDHEMILAKIMVNLFGNFVAKRTPTFTLENGEDFPIWNPIVDPRNMSFLLIHKKIKMIPEPYLKQTVYWESIGLPDTTPFINTTEHYRDYHFLTSTASPFPPTRFLPPPPAFPYSVSLDNPNPDVFELRNNLNSSLRGNRESQEERLGQSPGKNDEIQVKGQGFGEIEDSEPSPESISDTEEIDTVTTAMPTTTTSTSTSTTTTTTTTEPPIPFDEENDLYLPPWNPYGYQIPQPVEHDQDHDPNPDKDKAKAKDKDKEDEEKGNTSKSKDPDTDIDIPSHSHNEVKHERQKDEFEVENATEKEKGSAAFSYENSSTELSTPVPVTTILPYGDENGNNLLKEEEGELSTPTPSFNYSSNYDNENEEEEEPNQIVSPKVERERESSFTVTEVPSFLQPLPTTEQNMEEITIARKPVVKAKSPEPEVKVGVLSTMSTIGRIPIPSTEKTRKIPISLSPNFPSWDNEEEDDKEKKKDPIPTRDYRKFLVNFIQDTYLPSRRPISPFFNDYDSQENSNSKGTRQRSSFVPTQILDDRPYNIM